MKKHHESANNSELQHLFVDQLRDILWAEKHLLKALPKMAKAAKAPQLSQAFTQHQQETEVHVQRLSEIFSSLGLSARAKKCQAMQGLIDEADELADDYAESAAIDAALIAAAQKVEHYEIATYGTLRSFAESLGHQNAVQLLNETLQEESNTDSKLTEIARSQSNEEAIV
jgi:ferritin-like metal-binding protein YciE